MKTKYATKKARKNHRCIVCKNRISKGEMYVGFSITPWDHPDNDGFYAVKLHEFCDSFADFVFYNSHSWDEVTYDDIWDELVPNDLRYFRLVEKYGAAALVRIGADFSPIGNYLATEIEEWLKEEKVNHE